MVNGVCSVCGYKEPEKHAMSESQKEVAKEQPKKESGSVLEETTGKKKIEPVKEVEEKPVENLVQIEKDYKASCEKVNWRDLCRYPDKYRGKKIFVEVKIQQIMSSKNWRAQSDTSGSGWYTDDEYYLVDKRVSGAVKILEGDIVVVYGEFTGLETITRALTWTSSELPRVNVKYVDFVEWDTCEEIYNEYAQKIRDATPLLISEFEEEAKSNTDGTSGLSEIGNKKMSALAEIEMSGVRKMSSSYSNAGDTYDDYTEWSSKLWDVYSEESSKIQDAYIKAALG